MYVNTDIEINEDEMAEAIANSRYFTSAVESVVEDMDLQDSVAQALSDPLVEQAIKEVVEDALRDHGLLRATHINMQAQARIEALEDRMGLVATVEDAETRMSDFHARVVDLERQVATLQDTLASVAKVLVGVEVDTDAVSIAMTQADVEPAKAGQVLDTLERPVTFSGIY